MATAKTGKHVAIGAKPVRAQTPDDWVGDKAPAELTKRLTLDIPAGLHGRIKSACALRGTKMVEEITALLAEKYPPAE